MKRILFVINTLGRGGAEAALIEFIKKLDKSEYQVYLYVIMGQGELIEKIPEDVLLLNEKFDNNDVLSKEGKKHLKKNILKLMFSKGSVLKNFFYLAGNTLKMISKGKILPDKLLWKTLSDGAARFDIEFDLAVAYIEGASAYYVRDYVKAKKKAAFIHVNYTEAGYNRKLDKDVYVDFDKIFTVSEDVKESFLNEYPECADKADIFENIIDRDSVINRSNEAGGFDDEFDGKRILTIGRLTAQKAIDISIDACKFLKEKGLNVRWYVLGDGELHGELQKKIDDEGLKESFFLLGVKDNPYTYLRQCDIYVHASKYEGKSIAIREAQILSKPIVVSDCKSNLEQVEEGKDALVSILDSEALSEKIETLLKNEELRNSIAKKAGLRYLLIPDDSTKLTEML